MKSNVLFIPLHFRHWEMYLPLAKPLSQAGAHVTFVLIDGFHYVNHHPKENTLEDINVRRINISHKGSQGGRRQFFKLIYKELLPQWNAILNIHEKGIVVAPDYASIHRMILQAASKKGYINVALQDGSYIGTLKKYGSDLESKKQQLMKQLLLLSPLKKFMNLEFGASADYFGVFGEAVKKRLCEDSGFSNNRVQVVGSSRFNDFRTRVATYPRNKDGFNILCLPTNYDFYKDKRLEASQLDGMQMMVQAAEKLQSKRNIKIQIQIKVKSGYDGYHDKYDKLFSSPLVTVLAGDANLEALVAQSNLLVNTGGTSALEAAICHIPVIQIAPPYLNKKIKFAHGIPTAGTIDEIVYFMEQAIDLPDRYTHLHCKEAYLELAEIDEKWNSALVISNWLMKIPEDSRKGKKDKYV